MAGGPLNWGRALVGSSVIIGIGCALLKYNVPNEQELYKSLPPDLKRQVDAKRRALSDAQWAQTQQEEHRELAKVQDTAKPKWI